MNSSVYHHEAKSHRAREWGIDLIFCLAGFPKVFAFYLGSAPTLVLIVTELLPL